MMHFKKDTVKWVLKKKSYEKSYNLENFSFAVNIVFPAFVISLNSAFNSSSFESVCFMSIEFVEKESCNLTASF